MGAEHALFCHECKEWVDGHKCWAAYFATHEKPETYNECLKRNDLPFHYYWAMKMFNFLWAHKDHGKQVEWRTDTEDDFFNWCDNYKEIKEE